jgi:hypothetical protein
VEIVRDELGDVPIVFGNEDFHRMGCRHYRLTAFSRTRRFSSHEQGEELVC